MSRRFDTETFLVGGEPTRSTENLTVTQQIVLVGLGHTHLEIVRRWAKSPLADAALTVITAEPDAAYSGMWSGVLCGDYAEHKATVDAVSLCRAARATCVIQRAEPIDRTERIVRTAEGETVRYDWLSINVGSMIRPAIGPNERPSWWVSLKPLLSLVPRLRASLASDPSRLDNASADQPCRVVILGDGVAAVEVALCLASNGNRTNEPALTPKRLTVTILGRHTEPANELSPAGRKRVLAALKQRGIPFVQVFNETVPVENDGQRGVRLDGERTLDVDLVIEATGAVPDEFLATLSLTKDQNGFPVVRPTLQSVDDERIFLVGDAAGFSRRDGHPIAKAGVHAVREAAPLWSNLARVIAGSAPLTTYRPQRSFLKLLNAGDGRAIADWHGWSFHNRVCWWLKRQIDTRFIGKYQRVARPAAENDDRD